MLQQGKQNTKLTLADLVLSEGKKELKNNSNLIKIHRRQLERAPPGQTEAAKCITAIDFNPLYNIKI